MAAAIGVRSDFTSTDLRLFSRRCDDPDQVQRVLALAMILDGGSRSEAATIAGVMLQIVRDWVQSWLFCDTVDGARASAVTYSLMLTCRAWASSLSRRYAMSSLNCPSDLTTPISTTCCHLTSKDTPDPPTLLRWPVSSSVNYDGRTASGSNVLRNARLQHTALSSH